MICFVRDISRVIRVNEYISHVQRLNSTNSEARLFVIVKVNAALYLALAGLRGSLERDISDSKMV